jgi:DNA repair exonuclease SbcCD ATPase subunit
VKPEELANLDKLETMKNKTGIQSMADDAEFSHAHIGKCPYYSKLKESEKQKKIFEEAVAAITADYEAIVQKISAENLTAHDKQGIIKEIEEKKLVKKLREMLEERDYTEAELQAKLEKTQQNFENYKAEYENIMTEYDMNKEIQSMKQLYLKTKTQVTALQKEEVRLSKINTQLNESLKVAIPEYNLLVDKIDRLRGMKKELEKVRPTLKPIAENDMQPAKSKWNFLKLHPFGMLRRKVN